MHAAADSPPPPSRPRGAAELLTKNPLDCPPVAEGHGLNPAERVIQRFGGQSALAQQLGRRQSTVEHWAATGRIPSQWHEPLMTLARKQGLLLEARDFVEPGAHPIQ